MSLNIDLYNPANFSKHNLVKNLLESKVNMVQGTGDVTFAQCDDDFGVFSFDKTNTKTDPSPVTKGSHVNFNLAGIVSDEIIVDNLHIHVDWNGSTLYDEDHNQHNTYDSSYNYKLGWDVPSFAPSGHYHVIISGTGSNEGDNGTVLCVTADMDL